MNFQFSVFRKQKGQTLVELILVIGIAAIVLPALLTGLFASRNGKPQQAQRMQAITVLKETETAVRNVRNTNWAALGVNGTFHTQIAGSQWTLVGSPLTNSSGITQEVVISDVKRDVNGAIVQTGGTTDPSTKKITINISWTQPAQSLISSTLYLTNTKNQTKIHTKNTDFTPGKRVSTIVTNTAGGEVALEQSVGQADWCKPQDSVVENLTLPKKGNAITAPGVGSAYIATGDDAPGASFVNVGITYPIPPAPPNAAIAATHIGDYQTNAIYSDRTYAYLAINGTSQQVRILNIASQPYTEVGTITLPSNTNANGVYVSGNFAYVTSSNKLYKVDVTNKNGSHNPSTSKTMTWNLFETAIARQVVVVNNRVFVAVEGSLFGLQIYQTSNLALYGIGRPNFRSVPRGLFVNSDGSRAYVTFSGGNGSYSRGFYIINTVANRGESVWIPGFAYYFHRLVGSYDTGSTDPRGMAITPDNSNRALIGGIGGNYEYQVIDISNESRPTFCGGLDISQGVTGVTGALDQYGNAYSFLLTGDTSNQFRIIKGGAGGGGGGYAGSGTFESDTIDASSSAVFNRFIANVSQPTNTEIKLQVGVTTVDVKGSCTDAQYTYVGPDSTTGTYFTPTNGTISGTIPIATIANYYQNPSQCFRYKAYYTNSASATPTLYDFTVNYSP